MDYTNLEKKLSEDIQVQLEADRLALTGLLQTASTDVEKEYFTHELAMLGVSLGKSEYDHGAPLRILRKHLHQPWLDERPGRGGLREGMPSQLQDYFNGLRLDDRNNLVSVLQVLNTWCFDVVARGSTVTKPGNYKDIDLLIRGNRGASYMNALVDLNKNLGASVSVEGNNMSGNYVFAVTDARAKVSYNNTAFDIILSKTGKDTEPNPAQVQLLVNPVDQRQIETQRFFGDPCGIPAGYWPPKMSGFAVSDWAK